MPKYPASLTSNMVPEDQYGAFSATGIVDEMDQ